jgi:Dolichyl-phosphate-mannose-protein mannosyltransferase
LYAPAHRGAGPTAIRYDGRVTPPSRPASRDGLSAPRPALRTLPGRRLTAAALLVLGATIAVARLHTFDEPLERDITTYAVIGHELLAGRRLYSDLWDHKPPAIHLTFAAAEAVAGYGPREVYLLNVLAGLATMLGVWAAASACARSRAAGLLAAALWVVTSGDLALQANQPNTEVFLNACLIWALALLVPARRGRAEAWSTLAAGTLFALASLYKPVAVAVAVAAAAALVVMPRPGGAARRDRLTRVALLALPGAVAWLGLFGWFAASHRLGDVFDALVTFNRAYAGNLSGNAVAALAPTRLIPAEMRAVLPIPAAALLALAWAWLARRHRTAPSGPAQEPPAAGPLLAAYAVGVAAAVALPGRFYPHYDQLWLPIFAVSAAWATDRLRRALPKRGRPVAYALSAVLLGSLVLLQLPSYLLSPDEWSERKYGAVFVATRRAATAIDTLLTPGETFYEWGAETGLYFYTRRDPPTGVFFNFPLLGGPLAGKLSLRVIRDLAAARPELVVVASPDTVSFSTPVLQWVAQHYVAIPPDALRGAGFLLARRGGALEARLRGRAASLSH